MEGAAEVAAREMQDRLALLLIARPRDGWEREFEELIRREVERIVFPPEQAVGGDE
jgi:hypothetical protein